MAVKGSIYFEPEDIQNENPRHGSIRKALHSLVGTDSLLGKSAKMLDRPKSRLISTESNPHQQYLREYAILSEFNSVVERRISGIYIIPSAHSELLWFGVIFVRAGLYRGGVFRFNIHIPESFPNSPLPSLVFETNVFHPSIYPETYELNLKVVFSHWTKGVNNIWQVLDYTKSIFQNIPPKASSNKFAAELYERDKEEFARQVKICVLQSQRDIYLPLNSDDSHYLRFEEFDERKHTETLKILKNPKVCNKPAASSGLSWVKRGTLKPFTVTPFF